MARSLSTLIGRYGIVTLAVCFALGALVEDLTSSTVTIGADRYDRGPEPVIVATLVAVVGLVWLRHRIGVAAPLAAIALLGLASIAAPAWDLNSSFVFLLVMLLSGLSGYMTVRPVDYAGLLVLWAAGGLAASQQPHVTSARAFSVIAFMSIAWVAGVLMRRPVLQARVAEERASRLEHERVEAEARVVAAERRRIARELHDVIAHSVSVMTVQTGAVRRLLTPDQEREREALLAVERTGREAMSEMRRLVGLLKEDEEQPRYAPQPGMQALGALIDTMRAAGLPAELTVEGEPRPLSPGLDLAAYRVVQEALTNALKHAGPARASVRIRWGTDSLRVEVADDGRDGGARPGHGHGHAGMRERVALFGGSLESGPRPEGGYVVRASLPFEDGR